MSFHEMRRVSVFLVLGAIANVAVAWSCLYFRGSSVRQSLTVAEAEAMIFPTGAPLTPKTDFHAQDRGFGFELTRISRLYLKPNAKDIYDYAGWSYGAWSGGWPMLSVIGWTRHTQGIPPDGDCCLTWLRLVEPSIKRIEVIPYQPRWPGFAINTVFYAAILWLLFAAPLALRRKRRINRGLCPACAYPIGSSGTCTECGQPVKSLR